MENFIPGCDFNAVRVEAGKIAAVTPILSDPICDTGHNIKPCGIADLISHNILRTQRHADLSIQSVHALFAYVALQ